MYNAMKSNLQYEKCLISYDILSGFLVKKAKLKGLSGPWTRQEAY
jgi:hypothetical protein